MHGSVELFFLWPSFLVFSVFSCVPICSQTCSWEGCIQSNYYNSGLIRTDIKYYSTFKKKKLQNISMIKCDMSCQTFQYIVILDQIHVLWHCLPAQSHSLQTIDYVWKRSVQHPTAFVTHLDWPLSKICPEAIRKKYISYLHCSYSSCCRSSVSAWKIIMEQITWISTNVQLIHNFCNFWVPVWFAS